MMGLHHHRWKIGLFLKLGFKLHLCLCSGMFEEAQVLWKCKSASETWELELQL